MRKLIVRLVLVACVVALALGAGGCSIIAKKATEAAIEKGTGGKVNVEGDQVTITGENGASITTGGEQKIPDDFPSDVPVYEGAKVLSQMTSDDGNGKKGFIVNFGSADDVSTVFEWYTTKVKDEGWKIGMTAQPESGNGILTAEKEDYTLLVGVSESSTEGYKSEISIQVTPKQN